MQPGTKGPEVGYKGVPEAVSVEQSYLEDSGMRFNSPEGVLEGPTWLLGSLQKPDIAQQDSRMPRINRQYLRGHRIKSSQSPQPMPPASPNVLPNHVTHSPSQVGS